MKKEMIATYLAGLIQGVVLVAFPAASSLFTSEEVFNFSSTQYGSLFVPQSLLSIVASAFSSKISQKFGSKVTFSLGLFANLTSMSLFAFSALIVKETILVYPLLLLATSFLGIGFGLTVPTINTIAALLRPKQVNTVILVLNALLGIGTVLAPLFITIFIGLGIWWGLPVLLVISLALLIGFTLPLNFPEESSLDQVAGKALPKKALLFMAFALFYGAVETLNGNWSAIYMREIQGADIHIQSMALTIFWAMVTIGRVFFASMQRYLQSSTVYQVLPMGLIFAFLILGLLPPKNPYSSLFLIGVIGLCCSALLPLTISFGSVQLPSIARSIAGIVIAFYLLGYGIGAFGPGVAVDFTYTLSSVYVFSSLAALVLAILAFFINQKSGKSG
ncbi:MAG: MFS transporter [Waddliaceae bacterium]